MPLVALLCHDPHRVSALTQVRHPAFTLHPVSAQHPVPNVMNALTVLDFAGALVLGADLQRQTAAGVQRSSLDTRTFGVADTVTVTSAGLVGDYNLGRALAAALQADSWDVGGARAVVLGAGPAASVSARELASLGARSVTLFAADRPTAERALGSLAVTALAAARAWGEPSAQSYLEKADLLVRTDHRLKLDEHLLGPHLNIVDLAPEPLSRLRRAALKLGAKSLGLRDVQAYQAAVALGHVLGGAVEVAPFLNALHNLPNSVSAE